jgi:hypothetical protein
MRMEQHDVHTVSDRNGWCRTNGPSRVRCVQKGGGGGGVALRN